MKLSKNLSLAEAVRSETAKRLSIDNSPTKDHLDNLKTTADKVFQPIRDHFSCPIHVSSMYRSSKLNESLRYASKTSLHMTGQAIDIDMDYTDVSNKDIFNYIKKELKFDTLIWEYTNDDGSPKWVHVSYREGKNRNQVLEAYKDEQGSTQYKIYEQRKEKQKETKGDKSRQVSARKDRSTKSLLDLAPSTGILGVVKGLIQKDDGLTPLDKEEALKLIDMDIAEMEAVTRRWEADSKGSWLSQNVRPVSLIFMLFAYTIGFFLQYELDTINQLLLLMVGAYFGGRSFEKSRK